MENTNQSLFDINFDENVKQSLKGAAIWGGIAAIVSLVGSILGLVNYFVQKAKMDRFYSEGGEEIMRMQRTSEAGGLFNVALSLIIGIILFVFLFKFSNKTKTGVDTSDQYVINEGLGSLATYFKFIGILMIIFIALVGLVFLFFVGRGV